MRTGGKIVRSRISAIGCRSLRGGFKASATRRHYAAVGALIVAVGVTVSASATPIAALGEEGCGNEARRIEQRVARLPDCRAYELVTSAFDDNMEPEAPGEEGLYTYRDLRAIQGSRASMSGDRVAWVSKMHLPISQTSGLSYLSTRTPSGWVGENVIPRQSAPTNGRAPASELGCSILNTFVAYSSDLSRGVLQQQGGPVRGFHEEFNCGHDDPRLVDGEQEAFKNLFVRDNDSRSWQLVNITPPDTFLPDRPEESNQKFHWAAYVAGSEEFGHIVFEEEADLTQPAKENDAEYPRDVELYEWIEGSGQSDGQVRLITVLPDDTPVHGMLAGATRDIGYFYGPDTPTGIPTRNSELTWLAASVTNPRSIAQFRHSISTDGARIFFETFGSEAALYVREDGARTVQLDAPAPGATGPGGAGEFEIASADGRHVYFSADASRGLTADTQAGSGQNLYRFDLESETLTDLTAAPEAGVLGVMGGSDDGTLIYFVAEGAFAEGAHPAEPNLYLYREGSGLTYIATLDRADRCDWETPTARMPTEPELCGEKTPHWLGVKGTNVGGAGGVTSRTSASGRFLAFNSIRPLTGYDNNDAKTGEPDIEIFLYDALAEELLCASCNYGAEPLGPSAVRFAAPTGANGRGLYYPQRAVTDNGRLFFESPDPLVVGDTNGPKAADVYEWELPDTGSCTSQSPAYSPENGGCLYLLSSGHDSEISKFLDATPDGSTVFIETSEQLLSADGDSAYDIYAVRSGGGFIEPRAPVPCGGDSCRAALVGPPSTPAASSASFAGPGSRARRPHDKRKAKHRRGSAHRRKGRAHRSAPRHRRAELGRIRSRTGRGDR